MLKKIFFQPGRLFFRKAQSVTEYVVLVVMVAAALVGMQVYMKRGIQAGVKLVSDKIGDQGKGSSDYDFRLNWKIKGDSDITEDTQGEKITTQKPEGRVRYERRESNEQQGFLSRSLFSEKK